LKDVKEAGYKSLEEIASFLVSIAEDTLKKARVGYVKLADDQSLPVNPYHPLPGSKDFDERFAREIGYGESQQDMLEQGWKKVVDNESPV